MNFFKSNRGEAAENRFGVAVLFKDGRRLLLPEVPDDFEETEASSPSFMAELEADARESICKVVGGYCGGQCSLWHCYGGYNRL